MSDDVVWGDAPPQRETAARPREWSERLLDYRARPGEWGRLKSPYPKKSAYSIATRINTGKFAGVTAGEFEAVSRKKGDEHYVWVRYVGSAT